MCVCVVFVLGCVVVVHVSMLVYTFLYHRELGLAMVGPVDTCHEIRCFAIVIVLLNRVLAMDRCATCVSCATADRGVKVFVLFYPGCVIEVFFFACCVYWCA